MWIETAHKNEFVNLDNNGFIFIKRSESSGECQVKFAVQEDFTVLHNGTIDSCLTYLGKLRTLLKVHNVA
jgi:hypothetical protein